jgi:predicted alpha-1,2-mannosidase
MKVSNLVTLIIISRIFISCTAPYPADYVDPFICTLGDHGQWTPAALAPFGMIELGPDTYPGSLTASGDFAHGGYNFSDDSLRGFSHFHKPSSGGTSVVDRAGSLSVFPFTGLPGNDFYANPVAGFNKSTEVAQAGYYSVLLSKDNILSELTATPQVGIHRYSFPKGESAKIFLYEGNRQRSAHFSSKLVDELTVEGVQARWGGIFFVMKVNHPVKSTRTWDGEAVTGGSVVEQVKGGGMVLDFGDLQGKPLEISIGVSLTSIEAARKNLEAQCPKLDFSSYREKTFDDWNTVLGRVKVESDNEEYKTIFYTALFRTCHLPVVISDVDGTYPGLDGRIHVAEGYRHFADYAFWDDFRTKYPLYSLYLPGIYREIVRSLQDVYQQADNALPFPDSEHNVHGPGNSFVYRGENGFQAYSTCRHEHMLMTVTDAYFKGISDIDIETVYPYLRREALWQMPEKYDTIGYIPARPDRSGEYSWDNWCVAQIAKDIGENEDHDYFLKRSRYWENSWDPDIKYFRARAADGSWLDFPDDPSENREKYNYEGSKWHWRWNVKHDVASLIEKFGGKDEFVEELTCYFDNNLHSQGNQPSLHVPFLFNYGGAPWLTQKWTRKILTEPIVQKYGTHGFFPEPIIDRVYKASPDGYLREMDCDYGCMAAWYNMAAMGLYQVCPGNPVYQLTSPIFKKVIIHLDQSIYQGKKFTIEANNVSNDNIYIQSAMLNGKPLNQSWLTHADIVNGGKLILEMGAEPNKQWGVSSDVE